jgi:transaldolase
MKFFIDTGDIAEIEKAYQLGVIDGVTTNPTLIAKTKRSQVDVINDIAKIVDGPISAEVLATESQAMIEEGMRLAKIHPNVVIKLPLTPDGLKACKEFSRLKIKTNITLVFSANQALLAAKCGATYVSPFIGRLDDIGQNGNDLISDIKTIFRNYNFSTQILAASIRHPEHIHQVALHGADVATLPYKVLMSLYQHPLTTSGLDQFLKDAGVL